MYKVTLSMPIYNVAPYVERALLSALNQTFDSIEFLIVDDKGADNSMEIVRKIVSEHPRGKDVRIIEHPHNIGTGATKNTAIDNAQGEYLFFMDSDDEITPDCIDVLYNISQKRKVDFVAGSYLRKNIDGKFISGGLKYDYTEVNEKFYFIIGLNSLAITMWNKLYNLDFLKREKLRCIPHHLHEDCLFTYNLRLRTSSCVLVPNITLYYYDRVDSVMNKKYSQKEIEEELDVYNFVKSQKNKYVNEPVYICILRDLIRMKYNFLLRMPEGFQNNVSRFVLPDFSIFDLIRLFICDYKSFYRLLFIMCVK